MQGWGKMEKLATINQALMRGLYYCRRVFGGRAHFSASLPLLFLVRKVSLLNPYLDPACDWGEFTLWLTQQGMIKASTCGGTDASLMAQHLGRRLVLKDSLQTAVRVHLVAIPPAEEALSDRGMIDFVAFHLSSTSGWHSSAITELLCVIEL